jgi:hypothetical protein
MSQSLNGLDMKSQIAYGYPVDLFGLTFYPIKMLHYESFLSCKDAFALRMGSLPVKYLSKDFLSAAFAFEMDTYKEHEVRLGLVYRILTLFLISLRIEKDSFDLSKIIHYKTQKQEIVIDYISVTQNGKETKISPSQFSGQIRKLIADMNGIDLPDERENIDLVIANEQKKQFYAQKTKLDTSTKDLISSVALFSHCRECDIAEWSVREFFARVRAIERKMRYIMYGQAELSGMVSFKNGNPAPSWCYDILDESLGTQSLSELQFGNAIQKTQNQ